MLGYASDLAFYAVPDRGIMLGLNWRLMMGSAMIPAVIVCFLIFRTPESPRWYLTKGRHQDAYGSLCKLRFEKVQAARDLFYMHTLLEVERETMSVGTANKLKEFFSIRRNRNAMVASEIVMFMQQFCGVNVSFSFLFHYNLPSLTTRRSSHTTPQKSSSTQDSQKSAHSPPPSAGALSTGYSPSQDFTQSTPSVDETFS